MNKEVFEQFSDEKKKAIEEAYYAAFKKTITPSEFFEICKKTLTEKEFSALFKDTPKTAPSPPIDERATATQPPSRTPQREEIKTEHIEDIMQYSGIDLKEEADNIVKEAENNVSNGVYDETGGGNQIDSFFNAGPFREFVARVCASRSVRISEDGMRMLFMVFRRKLLNLVDKMAEACRVRVEAGLVDLSFKIDNEMSKQLWYLNELEKANMERLMIKKDEDQKKKKVIQEREDLLIKKRQSNSVAMAAMGLKQHSWMNVDSSKSSDEGGKFSSIYAPFCEKGFDEKIRSRVINMKDFIYVIERDKRYSKSIFLIQHYFK